MRVKLFLFCFSAAVLLFKNYNVIKADVNETTRIYSLTTGVRITLFRGRLKYFSLGLPIPMNNAFQTITKYKSSISYNHFRRSHEHNLRYFVFNLHDKLNKSKTVTVKLEFKIIKKQKTIKFGNILFKGYNKNSALFKLYTKSNGCININNTYIKRLAAKFKKFKILNRINRIFAFTRKYLRYTSTLRRYRGIGEILQTRCGDCSDYSTFFVTLLRACGIPARHVAGRVLKNSLRGSWYSWVEFYLEGYGWIPSDPANLDINDNGKTVAYMPFKYLATHTGVNVKVYYKNLRLNIPVMQTYYYFHLADRKHGKVKFNVQFLWKLRRIF